MARNDENKANIGLEALAGRAGCDTKNINMVFDTIKTMLEEGRTVTIPNFGRFYPGFTTPREVRSPVIPAGSGTKRRRKVMFRMSEALRRSWTLDK